MSQDCKRKDDILNEEQQLFRDIVMDYARNWESARQRELPKSEWPKSLRLVICGAPGSGKSSCVEKTMDGLYEFFGEDYHEVVRQATPTGAASFQMSAGATTIHRLFLLQINSKRGKIDDKSLKSLR